MEKRMVSKSPTKIPIQFIRFVKASIYVCGSGLESSGLELELKQGRKVNADCLPFPFPILSLVSTLFWIN